MKTFDLNGTKVIAKEFDFNMICDLEDMGITLQDMAKRNLSLIRAYVAICTNGDVDFAGQQIEQMVINGKGVNEIAEVMGEAIKESDFFRKINEVQEQKTTKTTSKKA